jgi:hypothetical protein
MVLELSLLAPFAREIYPDGDKPSSRSRSRLRALGNVVFNNFLVIGHHNQTNAFARPLAKKRLETAKREKVHSLSLPDLPTCDARH